MRRHGSRQLPAWLIFDVGQKMKHALAVKTTRYSELFRRLFDRYAVNCAIEVDGIKYGPADVERLKSSWCTNSKIRRTREFRIYDGDRFVASFHDSVDELFIAQEERDWIHSLSEERLLRYEILPIK
jgi:hypothetical protein